MKPALFSLLFLLPCFGAESFGGAQIAEVYRVRLDRGDLLQESIENVIHQYGIADGAVLTAAGSLEQCTFHRVKSNAEKPEDEFITVKEPMEILNVNGMIAGGEPHLHLTLSGAKGAFGGHLEKGCRVLYRAEITVAKFSGTPLARKPNKDGVPLLQRK
ncbi:MAG TPA: PPC domain-containing DNA-binding protein [Bryobacteraceae bacterium]|jgi:predicted DNA-binding protein with PD1-like motif|nr:PPC domain-containing DNA-binding protein [Bryobacteraceae bacterium]